LAAKAIAEEVAKGVVPRIAKKRLRTLISVYTREWLSDALKAGREAHHANPLLGHDFKVYNQWRKSGLLRPLKSFAIKNKLVTLSTAFPSIGLKPAISGSRWNIQLLRELAHDARGRRLLDYELAFATTTHKYNLGSRVLLDLERPLGTARARSKPVNSKQKNMRQKPLR